jgi:hypothetical protein
MHLAQAHLPPELAGRADLITAGTVALQRMNIGKPTQSLIGKDRASKQARRHRGKIKI